jgi:hypothetical protein
VTRDQLVETMARATYGEHHQGGRTWDEAHAVERIMCRSMATAALTAIEAAGMRVVLVEQWNALAHFARWGISEGPWQGGDLDGLEVQDKAEQLGLIVAEPGGYDEAKHGPNNDAEPGDQFFVYSPFLRGDAMLAAAQEDSTSE